MYLIIPPLMNDHFYLLIGEIYIVEVGKFNGVLSSLPFTKNNIKIVNEPGGEAKLLSNAVSSPACIQNKYNS